MTIRSWTLCAALLLAWTPALAAQSAPRDTAAADTVAPPPADPVQVFMYDLVDPVELGSAVALGLYDHVRVDPYEWGGGLDALTQRIASRAGGHIIGTSVRHGVAAALNRSVADEPCGCPDPEDRVAHAFIETFTDRDLRTGRRVFSEPFIAGTYAGALAPTLWHPDADLVDGIKSGTLSIVFNLAGRVIFALLDPQS
ncbi:hypothetical protein [Longimicrobium sp.]|uniref:hypothetical protein n=1 Tax=Longimicrobium sp. TaxID=2029185 RepID=UPI002E30EF8E|nr:hypothetical protein [Longimicrobium sp.]HEX6037446.1 hypothetical protein [Longimicrobium sp.]